MNVTSVMPGSIRPPRHPSAVIEQVAAIPIESSSTGSDSTRSMIREISVSTHPP